MQFFLEEQEKVCYIKHINSLKRVMLYGRSKQVILFPLLKKELTEEEKMDLVEQNLADLDDYMEENGVYLRQ